MNNNTVGSVQYDASINLDTLRASLKQGDKLVEQSYKNQANAAKKAAKSTSSSSGSASDAQSRVDAIKQQAQDTANALSTYTPQIQKQFLTVERANNQVAAASSRATSAIQRYGEGSLQATQATNSLNVAVGNQSQQQSKLTSMLNGSYKSQSNFTSSMGDSIVAIGGVVAGLTVLNATMTVIQNSVKAANTFESSIAGLARISQRFGYDANTATQAAQSLANDGLITVSTAANGLQKLLTAGVGLPDAIKLMQGYKDQAAFGKSSTIDFDTAVGNLSESFYTENSAIGNLSGQTENWSQILAYGASVLGKNVDQLSAKERIQAKLIGQQRLNNLVEGDSAVMAQTSAGKQALLNQTLLEMQTTIGRVINVITGGFIGALGGMNAEGQRMAISFAAGAAGFVAFLTIVPAAITAFRTIRTAIVAMGVASAFASGGLTAILGGLAALAAGAGVSELIGNLDTTEELSSQFADNVQQASGGLSDTAGNAAKTAKQLAKINDQMNQASEDYRYSLAQLVAEKNENIQTLQETLAAEKKAYDDSFNERLTSFNKSQNDELKTHQQKVTALQKQIDFLTKYNSAANQQQLAQLQFALAQENAEYEKSSQLRQDEFDAQTQSEVDEYQKRRDENQKKLDEEVALLEKHRQDVLDIRNVMLLDEIDTLKKQRDEQLKSLQEQAADIVGTLSSAGETAGKNAAVAFNKAFGAEGVYFDKATKYDVQKINGKTYVTPQFADGGFTGLGGKYDEAGVVHAGEYVVPREQVNQATGLPKQGAMGGGQSITVNLSMSGVMTSSKADERVIANRMGKLINETLVAKGAPAIKGI